MKEKKLKKWEKPTLEEHSNNVIQTAAMATAFNESTTAPYPP